MSSTPDFVNRVFVLHLPSGRSSNKSLEIQIHAISGRGVSRIDTPNWRTCISMGFHVHGHPPQLCQHKTTRHLADFSLVPDSDILSTSAPVMFAWPLSCHSADCLRTCCAESKQATSSHGDSKSSTLLAQASVQLAGQGSLQAG